MLAGMIKSADHVWRHEIDREAFKKTFRNESTSTHPVDYQEEFLTPAYIAPSFACYLSGVIPITEKSSRVPQLLLPHVIFTPMVRES